MAESLLFRKGSLAGLENASLVAGAVSFTTDEPAIYLDVQQGNSVVRKRVGDLIVYNTVAELVAAGDTAVAGTVGTWSTTALYYVVENNALMKWNGSKWTQINSVSDIEAAFNELDKIVNGDPDVESDKGLVGKVSTLENEVDAIQEDITDLQDKIGAVPADQNLYALISGEIARSTDKDDEHDEALEDLDGRVDTLEGYVGVPKNGDTAATGLHLAVDNNAAAIGALSNNFTEYKEEVSDAIAQALADAKKHSDDADTTQTAALEKKISDGDAATLQSAKDYTDAEIVKVGQSITALQNKDTELNQAIAANTKAITDEVSRAKGEEARIEGLVTAEANRAKGEEARIEGLVTAEANRAAAAEKVNADAITGLGNTITQLKEALEAEDEDIRADFAAADTALKTELKGYIDTNMAAADAMKYMGVVNSASDLPTTTEAIEAGWTYKVGTDFAANDKIDTDEAVILKGDLLIASADLAKGATIPNDFWHHVSSGYEDDKDQVLVGSNVAASGTQTAGAQVVLKSHTGDDRGSIAIVGTTNSNVRVTNAVTVDDEQTGDTSTVVTLSLEWGEF
ncbi:MAG: hypothetical protein IKT40_04950 [Bacilli bacterium]|nr:hypothetical protein [Bacilli bacterium]